MGAKVGLLEVLGIKEKPETFTFKSILEAANYMSSQKSHSINWNEVEKSLIKSMWRPIVQVTTEHTTLGIELLIQFYLQNSKNNPKSAELRVTEPHYFGHQVNKEEKPTMADIMAFNDLIRGDDIWYGIHHVVNKGCLKELGPEWKKVFTANAFCFWHNQVSDVLKKWEDEGAPITQFSESNRKGVEIIQAAVSEWGKKGLYVPIN